MMMFHPDINNIGDGRRYANNWVPKVCPTTGELAHYILKYANSPCMWAGGTRNKENFRYANWFGLDFDEGMTLDEAKEIFKGYLHVIATTKSHQVEKGKKKCDRFRVFLKFGVSCKTKEEYEATAIELINKYGADKACKDAARFFWPCKEIVSKTFFGREIHSADPSKVMEEENKKKERIKKHDEKIKLYYAPTKKLHSRYRRMLDGGVPDGERSIACYKVSREMTKVGYSECEIFDTIWNSQIPYDSSESCKVKVMQIVGSAFKKGKI